MPNQESSPPPLASSGVVVRDWAATLEQIREGVGDDPLQIEASKSIFYIGYLMCYNNLMNALRATPADAALVTMVIRDELNQYFK